MTEEEFKRLKRNWEKNQTKQEEDAWFKAEIDAWMGGLEGSAIHMSIVSDSFLKDPRCALQLGYALFMDKPILLLVEKGLELPKHLIEISSFIEYVDRNDPSDVERGMKSLTDHLKKLRNP